MSKLDPEVKRAPRRAPPAAWGTAALLLLAAIAGAPACDRRTELLGTLLDAGRGDGPPATPPRFSPSVLVAPLSDPNAIDEDPTFTADLLELYFMSNRAGTRDIFTSRRAAAEDPWGPPSRVGELSSPESDWAAAVSLDGLRIWFASDRDSVGRAQLWRAVRPARSAAWERPEPVRELASGSADFAPAIDATETLMFFASDRAEAAGTAGGADFDLHVTSRTGTAAWGPPILLAGANSGSDEYDPFVAQGGLVVFFTSMRSGMGDIFWSARRSVAEPFPDPVPLADVSSEQYDSDATLSLDLGYLMFSSTRSGNAELYEARALP